MNNKGRQENTTSVCGQQKDKEKWGGQVIQKAKTSGIQTVSHFVSQVT